MQHEVCIISDDSDKEPALKSGYLSDDSEVVCLSQPSSQFFPPSSNLPSSQSPPQEYNISDLELGDESDVELNIGEVITKAKSQKNGVASQGVNNQSPTTKSKRLKSVKIFDSSPEEVASTKPTKRPKQCEEQKALKKAQKEIEKQKKKEDTARKKAAAAAKKEAEKVFAKAVRNVNKLVSDKKATLKDITVELSPNLFSSPLATSLTEKMNEFDSKVRLLCDSDVRNTITNAPTNLNTLGLNLVRWQRRVAATYDREVKRWVPLEEPFTRIESTYLIYLTDSDVLRSISAKDPTPSLRQQVETLRNALGPKHNIHLMVVGLKTRADILERVERELVELQVREGVYVEEVPNEDEAVTWIYNISADLGIKPYKLIERSHLAFCGSPSAHHEIGKNQWDTAKKMLVRLPRLTDAGSAAILKEYQSINNLMEAYQDADSRSGSGAMLLENIETSKKRLGNVMSQRLHKVLWGQDPKALVN